MLIEPDISTVAIVLVGSFNPPIFNPHWFARHALISPKEADAAQVNIIHPQIADFTTEWLEVRATPERFQALTHQQPFTRLCDFVVRTFTEFLPHTPIQAGGINRSVDFKVGSSKVRDRIGYKLAPPEAWGEWAEKIKSRDGERHGGMVLLVVQQQHTDDRPAGHIQATVQPSQAIAEGIGVSVQINDHYALQQNEHGQDAEVIIELLASRFQDSVNRSEWIIDQVMGLGSE